MPDAGEGDGSVMRWHARDVPDRPVLAHLARYDDGGWCNWATPDMFGPEYHDLAARSVRLAMPDGTPDKVVLAKMRRLIRRGLVSGCPCGCRGDFEITAKGRAVLEAGP